MRSRNLGAFVATMALALWITNEIVNRLFYPVPVAMPAPVACQSLDWAQEQLIHQPTVLPIVGDGILTRIDEVQRNGDQLILADPCTHQPIRELEDTEIPPDLDVNKVATERTLVTEHFAKMPDKTIALTFDDGPDPEWTPQVQAILKKERVPATFFMIGKQVPGYGGLVRSLIADGNMVGNHTENHYQDWSSLSASTARAELNDTDRNIRAAADYTTHITRAPDADADHKALEVLVGQQQSMVQVGFDIDSLDWDHVGQDIAPPPLDGKGHVILMHDGGGDRSSTLKLLQAIITEGKARGYAFTTVEPMLAPAQRPQQHTPASFADSWNSFWEALWNMGLSFVTHYGIVSVVVVSSLYVVLAWVNHVRTTHEHGTYRKRVAVVMPVHRERKTVRRAIESVLVDNADHDVSMVVVPNGSTDGTDEIVEAMAQEYANFHVLKLAKGDKAEALNAAIQYIATTEEFKDVEVVMFVDGDGVILPGSVHAIVQPFADPTVGVVAGQVRVGNRKGLLGWYQSTVYLITLCIPRNAQAMANALTLAPGAICAFSLEALLRIGGFPKHISAEDYAATLAARKLGYKVKQCNAAVCRTDAPSTYMGMIRQWTRWGFGIQQAAWANIMMMLNPFRYGFVSPVMLYDQVSFWMSFILRFLVIGMGIAGIIDGQGLSVALYAILIAAIDTLKIVSAVIMLRDDPKHILIAPVLRIINEVVQTIVQCRVAYYIAWGRGKPFTTWLSAGTRSGTVQREAALDNPVESAAPSSLLAGTPR